MKKHFLTLCLLLISIIVFAGKFVLIPVSETNNLETLFNNNDLKIHYYNDNYVLATTENLNFNGIAVLDEHAFTDVDSYAIVYCSENQKETYLARIAGSVKTLFSGENFFIMKLVGEGFIPAKNDGMIMITNTEARLLNKRFEFPVITEVDPFIQFLEEKVITDTLIAVVQHLQDYFTRRCDHATSILAQDWIKLKFEDLGLEAKVQNFSGGPWWGGTFKAGNVYAVQQGTELANEYIVCGCHFDSFAWQSPQGEPGADDNATGVAGVLETARLLSQYNFKRSIIYCTFTAEECGLNGSGYYATQCKNQGMNIIGYFNIDMSGYLKPGTDMHIDLIHPSSANPLATYYKNIGSIYHKEIPIVSYPNLPGGDSDHTSFNNNGYMGIFPFEDHIYDSPHIHSSNDLIGPSVNTPEQVRLFTQMNIASIATLAILDGEAPVLNPPTNCKAEYIEDMHIKVTWDAPEEGTPDKYNIYRDGTNIAHGVELSYMDTVSDFKEHCYYISAIYGSSESEFSNESCVTVPAPPTNCVAEYFEDMSIKVTWKAPENITPELYYIYRDNEKIFQQEELSYIDEVEDYLEHCYKITAIYGTLESDFSNESCASGLRITENLPNFNIYPNPANTELRITNYKLRIEGVEIFDIYGSKQKIEDRRQKTEDEIIIDVSHLQAGIYFLKITTEKTVDTIKIVKN
jgi:hypothetical protein